MKYYYTSSLNSGDGFTFSNDTHCVEGLSDVIIYIEGRGMSMLSCVEITQFEYHQIIESRR